MFRTFIRHISQKSHLQELSDEQLISLYKKNTRDEVIGEFFNRYIHLIYAVCMKYLKDDEKAQDFAMLVFEGLGKKLIDFDISNFKSWLLTIARNNCLMELRKRKREIAVDGNEIFRIVPVEIQEENHLNEDKSLDDQLSIALQKLKQCQRVCIEMMYFKDKSYKDISNLTGFSLKEVKSYIQNGKRNLKSIILNRDEQNS